MDSQTILNSVRAIAREHGVRVEVSSDDEGALGLLCCCVSNSDRSRVGFGRTIDEALAHYKAGGTDVCRPAGLPGKRAA